MEVRTRGVIFCERAVVLKGKREILDSAAQKVNYGGSLSVFKRVRVRSGQFGELKVGQQRTQGS